MPLMETLQDDFSVGTYPDATLWPLTYGPTSHVFLSGGVLNVKSTENYYACASAQIYTIAGSYLMAKVVAPNPTGSNQQRTHLTVVKDGSNFFWMFRYENVLYWQALSGGGFTSLAYIAPYNPTTMAWWRIRHDGSGFYAGYSSDATTWTEVGPFDTFPVNDTMSARFTSDHVAGDSPITATFDLVNMLPPVAKSGSDTASGADSVGTVAQQFADNDAASVADSGDTSFRYHTDSDTAAGADTISNRSVRDADSARAVESGSVFDPDLLLKTESDTVATSENQNVLTPGNFTQIPVPKLWSNGDSISGGILNKEWRDTFNFLLRKTSPGFEGYNSSGPTLSANVAIPLTTQTARGNLEHAAADTKVWVWEDGFYVVLAHVGATLTGVTGTNFSSVLKVNGLVAATGDITRSTGSTIGCGHLSSVHLAAGDYVELALGGSWTGTVIAGTAAEVQPRLAIWWRNN